MSAGRKVWVKIRASEAERAEWHAKRVAPRLRVEIQHKDPFLSGPGHDRGRTGRRE